MASSFEEFCGHSPFLDVDLLMNSTYPHFTECFQDTVLVWVPCGILWLMTPGYLLYMIRCKDPPLPVSCINITKTVFSVILFFVSGIEVLYAASDDRGYSGAYYLSFAVKAGTFLLAALTVQLERRHGVKASGVMFMFWFLSTIAGVVPFYTLIIQQVYYDELFRFTMFFLYYLLVLVQLVLASFAEIYHRDGYQTLSKPQSPEVDASFPSQVSFWWVTSVVTGIFRNGINEAQFWELHPRDQSANFLPRFLKGIKDEFTKHKDKLTQPSTQSKNSVVYHNTTETTRLLGSKTARQNNGYDAIGDNKNDVKQYQERSYKATGEHQDGNKRSQEKSKKSGPSLLKVLVKNFGRYFFLGWSLKLVDDCLTVVSPLILNLLIGYVEDKNSGESNQQSWKGYVYALAFFAVATVQSTCFQNNLMICWPAAIRVKSALIAAVYRKSLTLSNEARKTRTQGEIVNLMAIDCQRMQDVAGFLFQLWSSLIQATIAMVVLWSTLGPSVLAGVAVLLILTPSNVAIAVRLKKLQVRQMGFKDQRLKLMSEILNGVKVLKLYAWEQSFEKKVREIRDKELGVLRKSAYLNAFNTFILTMTPFFVTLTTFATYILLDANHTLDAQKAFVSLALFNILKWPMTVLPNVISYIVQGQVSAGRLSAFLQAEDLDPDNVEYCETADYALSVKNGTFTWDKQMDSALKDINLEVPEGRLVAVVGQVGAGKSSLLSAFLGEMEKLEGHVKVKGRYAYVPQQAFMQHDTLKGNILFGMDTDPVKYRKIIDACALRPDLEILQGGDRTEIGEKHDTLKGNILFGMDTDPSKYMKIIDACALRADLEILQGEDRTEGINLSGGQKQRVSLARAVYHDADIYLLDDPLSAVDSHVGKHIFTHVIGQKGMLRNKTRILVTHGVHWLPMVDQIVVIVNGRISELGSYEELMSHDGAFAQFLKTYLAQEEEDDDDDPEVQQLRSQIRQRMESVTSDPDKAFLSSDGDKAFLSSDGDTPTRVRHRAKKGTISKESSLDGDSHKADPFGSLGKPVEKLIEEERAAIGNVAFSVYMRYMAALGALSAITVLLLLTAYQGAGIGNGIWLASWTDDPYLKNVTNANTTEYKNKNYEYLGVYGAIGLVQASIILVYAMLSAITMVRAAGKIHNAMLSRVLKLPMTFFDTTPLGRIVNRFSRDVEVIDNTLPMIIKQFLFTMFSAMSTFVVVIYTTPLFAVILLPMGLLYYIVQRVFIPSARQLRRIESTTRSPVYSHFGESITGVTTIRGYRAQQRFIDQSGARVDRNLVFFFALLSTFRWLSWRLDILGSIIVSSAAVFAVVTPDNTGGLVGLSISYALQVTSALKLLVRAACDMETNAVSVERVKEYTEKPTEAAWIVANNRPDKHWPTQGNIQFRNYCMRYRDGLELVLKGITFDIKGGERIGIVGRTGAGKSSLTVALFRLIEPAAGQIIIDGENIADMGLHDLRAKLTILPQDPVLFSGTLRMNLDPFDEYSDEQVWRALDHAHLKTFVWGLRDRLEHECGEGGQNLSVGQRQLVCLTRTLLRKTKILIFDEATAAVDMETDELIQTTIREDFRGCTILTIAHRLNTIMDYDRIMVLDKGLVKEFDSPQTLLENNASHFYGMARDANLI